MELVAVYQVFEEPNEEAYSGPSEMGPEAFNPLIGDRCPVAMTGIVPTQENLYCCHGSVLHPTVSPQDLGTFARYRQAPCVVVGNHGRVVVGVAYFQPHNTPGIAVHTSVYGKAVRLQLVIPVCVP